MTLTHSSKLSKIVSLFCLILVSCVSVAQTNQIVLENKKTQKKVRITENKRIKVVTTDGKKYVGKFSIIDDTTIKIDENSIALDSIATIQKRSVFSSIARPVLIVLGTVSLVGAIAGAAYGGYGYIATLILVPIGTPMVLIPLSANRHKNENWSYTIEKVE